MVAAVLAGHSIAGADNYGYVSGYPNRFPDDTSSHYCFRDVAAQADRDRINFAEGVLDSQTVMYDQYVTTCGVSTDAAWEFTDWCDTPFPSGCPLGYTPCEYHSFWGICDRFGVYIDPYEHYFIALEEGFYGQNLNLSVCHELGHSAGLWHLTTDPATPSGRCMNSAWIYPANGWEELNYVMYSDHHVWHINDYLS